MACLYFLFPTVQDVAPVPRTGNYLRTDVGISPYILIQCEGFIVELMILIRLFL